MLQIISPALHIKELHFTNCLQCCRSLSTAEDALRHATDLQKDGLRLCQEEFMTILKGNLQEPNAARLVQASSPSLDTPVAGAFNTLLSACAITKLVLISLSHVSSCACGYHIKGQMQQKSY